MLTSLWCGRRLYGNSSSALKRSCNKNTQNGFVFIILTKLFPYFVTLNIGRVHPHITCNMCQVWSIYTQQLVFISLDFILFSSFFHIHPLLSWHFILNITLKFRYKIMHTNSNEFQRIYWLVLQSHYPNWRSPEDSRWAKIGKIGRHRLIYWSAVWQLFCRSTKVKILLTDPPFFRGFIIGEESGDGCPIF